MTVHIGNLMITPENAAAPALLARVEVLTKALEAARLALAENHQKLATNAETWTVLTTTVDGIEAALKGEAP